MKSGRATADGSTEFWDQEISLKDTFVFTAPEENEHLPLKRNFHGDLRSTKEVALLWLPSHHQPYFFNRLIEKNKSTLILLSK